MCRYPGLFAGNCIYLAATSTALPLGPVGPVGPLLPPEIALPLAPGIMQNNIADSRLRFRFTLVTLSGGGVSLQKKCSSQIPILVIKTYIVKYD